MAARRRGAHAAAGRAQARLLRPRGCRPPAASVVACTPEAPCRRVGGAATGGAAEAAPPNGPEAAKNDRARRPIHGAPEPEEQAGWRRPRVGQPAGARLTLSDCDTRDTFSTLFHKSTLARKAGGGHWGCCSVARPRTSPPSQEASHSSTGDVQRQTRSSSCNSRPPRPRAPVVPSVSGCLRSITPPPATTTTTVVVVAPPAPPLW